MSFKRFRTFFNKENFDYCHGEVNPLDFFRPFYILTIAFRVVDEAIPKWTIVTPLSIILLGMSASIICSLSTLQYVQAYDMLHVTEAGTYVIIMIYKLLIISCTITDKPNYHALFQELKDDFNYICTDGSKYREKYFNGQLWTFKATIMTCILLASIFFGMVIYSNFALVLTLLLRPEGSDRPLPVPILLFGKDIAKSPTYEILFVWCIACTFSHCYAHTFMMQTQIIWIRQMMSKADVVVWNIEDLLVDVQPAINIEDKEHYEEVIKARMRFIMKMHQSLFNLLDGYASVYTKVLMFEQKLVAPMVCLTTYCAAESLDAGEFAVLMVLFCFSAIILTGIPCYMCTILTEKIQSIGDACWNIPFWNAPGKVIRPYLVLIMQRSTRSLPVKFPGFDDVSLETFSRKISFAYSCFNMLRQGNFAVQVTD